VATQEQFPHRVVPNSKTFTSTVQWLRDTGKFHPRTEDRSQRVLDVEPQSLETVEANPGRSTRRLAPQVGLSHHVVCAIAHFKRTRPATITRRVATSKQFVSGNGQNTTIFYCLIQNIFRLVYKATQLFS
jgi:hypothetical protein